MDSAPAFLHRHSFSTTPFWMGIPSHSVSCFTRFSAPPNPTSGRSIPAVSSSSSSSENSGSRRRQKSRAKQDTQQEMQKQPSVAEIERALGVGKSNNTSKSRPKESPGLLDLIELDPFGEEEGTLERKLREAGDWIIERTERGQRSGQESLLLLLLKLFPVWCFFLLLASGVIKLPFPVPFLDEYM